MKVKRKTGMGMRRKPSSPVPFRTGIVSKVKKALNQLPSIDLNDTRPAALKKTASLALRAARVAIKKAGGRKNVRIPRIIPFEAKSGGIIPLIPIFAALGALGSLAGGAGGVAKTIIDAKNAQKKLEEDHRHNKAMEALGKGLYLRRNKRGYGLFLKKQKNY
jgi:hypothetical protein